MSKFKIMTKFVPGQVVRVRTLEELAKIGTPKDDRIEPPEYVIQQNKGRLSMLLLHMADVCCGKQITLKRTDISGYNMQLSNGYVISPWMCKLIKGVKE